MSDPLTAAVIHIQHQDSLPAALGELDLIEARPTLVLVGGASKLSQTDYQRITSLFTNVLAPLAEKLGLYVVDGGTDAGIMKIMGQARMAIGAEFPLVGVAPVGLVNLPNHPTTCPDSATLEANHTHCLLIPGHQWGDESPWMANVATHLAQDKPSVVVLINGGSVTWQDAAANVAAGRPIIVIQGSGRTADILATAVQGDAIHDERAKPLVDSGLMQVLGLNESTEVLTDKLRALLG
ncbi:MAG: hypothetical protein AAGC54_02225 [Cyanobacteria bacterium P01_F01_bin.4]